MALDGLENILKVGELDKTSGVHPTNQMALYIEECGGMDNIDQLQYHDSVEIYKKSLGIIDRYFSEEEEDTGLKPEIDENTGSFAFSAESSGIGANVPQGGFTFGS